MISTLVSILIYLLIVGAIAWVAVYVLDALPVPQPFNRIGKVIIAVICLVIVVTLLLRVANGQYDGLSLP